MKYIIEIDSEDIEKYVKKISIGLAVFAVLLFLILSGVVFKYSQREPILYNYNYRQLSSTGQVVADSMQKTGEVEDSILNNKNAFRNTKNKNNKNAFFDEVSKRHKK